MIFEQPLSIPFAVAFITIVSMISVGYRIFAFNKQRYFYLYGSPSVVVAGHLPYKTHFVKSLTKKEVLSHPADEFKNEIGISYMDFGKKKIQLVDPKNIFIGSSLDGRKIDELKKINCRLLLYLFDVSHNAQPINEQIKNFRRTVSALDDISYIPVMNKIDACDDKKLEKLRQEFKNIHEFPSQNIESLMNSIASVA